MARFLSTILLISVILCASFSYAEELVPRYWDEGGSLNSGKDGETFTRIAEKLRELSGRYIRKDSTVLKGIATVLSECNDLALRHSYEDDPEGAELINRVRFWVMIISGTYSMAQDVAKDLCEHTGDSRYYLWLQIAKHKAFDKDSVKTPLNNPDAAFSVSHFLSMIGRFEQSAQILKDVWSATASRNHRRVEAALLCADNYYQMGKLFSARKVLFSTLQDTTHELREVMVNQIGNLRFVTASKTEEEFWASLAKDMSLGGWNRELKKALEEKKYQRYFEMFAILFAVAPAGEVSVPDFIENLTLLGLRDQVREFSIIALNEEMVFDSLCLAFLELDDTSNAIFWLEKSLSTGADGMSRLCREFYSLCRIRNLNVEMKVLSSRIPSIAQAYFALEYENWFQLEAAVEKLQKSKKNPYSMIITLSALAKRGMIPKIPIATFLSAIEPSKKEIERGWLEAFGFPSVVRTLVKESSSEYSELERLIVRLVDFYVSGDNAGEVEKVLCFSSFCRNDERFNQVIVTRMMKVFGKAEKELVPKWALDFLASRMEVIGTASLNAEKVEEAGRKFFNHPGLLIVAARMQLAADRKERAKDLLETAYVNADVIRREIIEQLIKQCYK